MSDLRVTDVQAALRHFSDIGHDILSDTQAVHMNGKPYRLALGHQLNMGNVQIGGHTLSAPILTSHVQQAEAPIISQIATGTQFYGDGETISHRRLSALTPRLHPRYSDEYQEHRDYDVGEHSEGLFKPKGNGLWAPTKKTPKYADIHEALASHTKQDDAYHPHYDDYDQERPMTQKEYSGFNHKEALSNTLFGATPHRGLVVVNYVKGQTHQNDDKWHHALYDTNSEQLLPHDWQHADWKK